jgi:hypothetical protein
LLPFFQIVLTIFVVSPAFAASKTKRKPVGECETQVLSGKDYKFVHTAIKKAGRLEKSNTKKFTQYLEKIEEAYASIENLGDLKSFMQAILDADMDFGDPFDERFTWLMNHMNFVEKYIKVSRGSKDQVQDFDDFLQDAVSDYDGRAWRQSVDSQLVSLQYHLHPEKFLHFIDNLRHQYAYRRRYLNFSLFHSSDLGHEPLDEFNQGALTMISRLPEEFRLKALAMVKEKIANIEPYELEPDEPEDGGERRVTEQRRNYRNLEILLHLLLEPERSKTFQELRAAKTRTQVVKAVDRYFKVIGKYLAHHRGGYSFARIIEMGEGAQGALREYLDDGQKYFELYGSAPNGKADLEYSDKDAHFSSLAQAQIFGIKKIDLEFLPFSLQMDNIIRHFREKPEVQKFWKAYQRAEKTVADISGRKRYMSGSVLTHSFPYQEWSQTWDSPMFYNPFVVRIYANKLTLRVYKMYGEKLKLVMEKPLE